MNYKFVRKWPKWLRVIIYWILVVIWVVPMLILLIATGWIHCFVVFLYHGPDRAGVMFKEVMWGD